VSKAISYIRFSTKSQGKDGRHSQQRQIENTAAYCAEHGLELDETLRDLGKSAYKSKHIKNGALGRFLERLAPNHSSHIPNDTILIVEAMDRLNRAAPREALAVFLDIINHGVTIVTLCDKQRYDKASIDANMGQLFLSIGLMFGAHMESRNKGNRVKASWTSRRTRVTKMTPGWITVVNGKYLVRPECSAVIEYIFEQCRDGIGLDKIAATLNAKGVPPFSTRTRTSAGWYDSYIRKMITGRTILGEVQDYEYDGEVRVPTGTWRKPYPAAISITLWQDANDALVGRRTIAGRKGETFINLLQGLAVCPCGAPMRIRVKGNRNHYTYYQCRDAKRGLCDHNEYVNYRPVEAIVLSNFGMMAHGLDTPIDTESVELLGRIETKRHEMAKIATSISRYHHIIEAGVGAITAKRLADLEADHAAGLGMISEMEGDLGRRQRAKPRREDILALKALIAGLDELPMAELYTARARINTGLAKLLSCVVVTRKMITLRLAENFNQLWRVQGTGRDRQPITGVIKEFRFKLDDPSKAIALVD
jgi:DNA invertase Pin-like site-specific DNA recombinase